MSGASLLRTDGQGELFRPEDMPEADQYFARAAEMGEYTGELLFRKNPRLYKVIAGCIAAGMAVRRVADLCGVCCRTVMAVRDREPETIATLKERLSKVLLHLGLLGAEAVLESLENGESVGPKERKDLMIAVGIAIDKGFLSAGEATWRGEMVQAATPKHEDWERLIHEQVIEGETTDLSGGTPGQKGNPTGRDGLDRPAPVALVGPVGDPAGTGQQQQEGGGT